jgi:uncharacterized membrane protein YfcA
MCFPTAGIEVAWWLPPVVAFSISFFTSMGGVSGAFLLLPFQVSVLHFTDPSVSATNQLFNVVAIPVGVHRYVREGRMVWPLTWAVVAGTLPGVFLGAIVRVRYLPDPKYFKPFVGVVLLYIGTRMVHGLLGRPPMDRSSSEERFRELVRQQEERAAGESQAELPVVRLVRVDLKRIVYEFYGEQFEVSVWGLLCLSGIVGVVGGIYGIGGGAIIAPFFVSVFKLPVYTIAGATLMGTFVTSIAGVAFYQAIAPFYPQMAVAPDWGLGILFGLGGMVGMYLGARCQKHVPARAIKWLLVVVLLFAGTKYVTGL